MKKKTTIEDLAVMIKRGFDETARKVDMDSGFARVDAQFEKVKTDIARLEKEIAELRKDMAFMNRLPVTIERRVERLEDDLRLVKTKVGIR